MENTKGFEHLHPEAQTQMRMRAIEAVRDGVPQVLVAKLYRVTSVTVSRWMRRAREGGLGALEAQPRGPNKPMGALSLEEQASLVEAIREHTPPHFGLPFSLWKRKAVVALVEKEFGKKVSVWTAGRYLQKRNYTPQKPQRRAYQQDPQEKERFLHRRFPAIARSAREHGAVLVWTDETGFRSTDTRGRSYAPQGAGSVIDISGRRFACSMISGITADGRAEAMVFTGSFTAEVFIAFLEVLISRFHEMVYLLMDEHPVHMSAMVQEWLKEHHDRIRAFTLPGYSPELNPPEMLNNDAKAKIADAPAPLSLTELVAAVSSAVKNIVDNGRRIAAYFHNSKLVYILR